MLYDVRVVWMHGRSTPPQFDCVNDWESKTCMQMLRTYKAAAATLAENGRHFEKKPGLEFCFDVNTRADTTTKTRPVQ